MFAIPLRRPNAQLVVKGLILIFTRHAYVPNIILKDRDIAFTAYVLKRTMEQARVSIKHATIKHAQAAGIIEQTHQKSITLLRINISADQRKWDQCVNIAVTTHNTTYHASLKCAPTEFFHVRTRHSALDLKFENPIPVISQPTDISNMLDEVNKNTNKLCITSSQPSIKT